MNQKKNRKFNSNNNNKKISKSRGPKNIFFFDVTSFMIISFFCIFNCDEKEREVELDINNLSKTHLPIKCVCVCVLCDSQYTDTNSNRVCVYIESFRSFLSFFF